MTPRDRHGLSTDAVLMLLRLWIALLVHYGQENASRTLPISSDALRADTYARSLCSTQRQPELECQHI